MAPVLSSVMPILIYWLYKHFINIIVNISVHFYKTSCHFNIEYTLHPTYDDTLAWYPSANTLFSYLYSLFFTTKQDRSVCYTKGLLAKPDISFYLYLWVSVFLPSAICNNLMWLLDLSHAPVSRYYPLCCMIYFCSVTSATTITLAPKRGQSLLVNNWQCRSHDPDCTYSLEACIAPLPINVV